MAWAWPSSSKVNTMMNRMLLLAALLAAGSSVQAADGNQSDVTGVSSDTFEIESNYEFARQRALSERRPPGSRLTNLPPTPEDEEDEEEVGFVFSQLTTKIINIGCVTIMVGTSAHDFHDSESLLMASTGSDEDLTALNFAAQSAGDWTAKFSAAEKSVNAENEALEAKKESLWTEPGKKTVQKLNSVASSLKQMAKKTDALLAVYAEYFAQEKDPKSSFGQAVRKGLAEVKNLAAVIEVQSKASRYFSDRLTGKKAR